MSKQVTEKQWGAAIDTLQKWYADECRACAQAVLQECKDNPDRDESDALHETIDGHEFIIYTFKAQLVIALSSNASAYEDDMGEAPITDETRAFYAMRADVMECIEAFRDEYENEAP